LFKKTFLFCYPTLERYQSRKVGWEIQIWRGNIPALTARFKSECETEKERRKGMIVLLYVCVREEERDMVRIFPKMYTHLCLRRLKKEKQLKTNFKEAFSI
jgi:hypothetical protein